MREDFQVYYEAALSLALAYPGLTVAEYRVMSALVSDYSDTSSGLAKYISAINEEPFDEALSQKSVASLIQKGYVCVLDADLISRMRTEIAREDIASLDYLMPDNCFHPGEVDLTEQGYLAYRDVTMKVYGMRLVYDNEAGWVDNGQGNVKVYAGLDWSLYTKLGQAIESLIDDGKQILAVQKPFGVGRYRPNRFITFQGGLCVMVEYANELVVP